MPVLVEAFWHRSGVPLSVAGRAPESDGSYAHTGTARVHFAAASATLRGRRRDCAHSRRAPHGPRTAGPRTDRYVARHRQRERGSRDGFHWQTNTVTGGGFVQPGTDFDSFMGTVKSAGAQAILIANYGSGSAQEAADWVKYANITKGYHDQYCEIGNEVYGNGYYGADWELDNHASKSPATYASNVVQYAQAMKAVDPTIKIGVVLTNPYSMPNGKIAGGDSTDWNQTVLPIVETYVDFAIVHN